MTPGLRLLPGALVVLEGLDKAGKSTQAAALESQVWEGDGPAFTHMPSGFTALTKSIYRATEEQRISSPLARQLLHLACHAENVPSLAAERDRRGVILDRWWWSTVAYGWFGGLNRELMRDAFFGAIDMVWGGIQASLVFVFLDEHEEDPHNLAGVRMGYEWLIEENEDIAVRVPLSPTTETTEFLLEQLHVRGLIESRKQ